MSADGPAAIRARLAAMTRATYRPVIRTQSDLEGLWRRLLSPLGFHCCSLWLVVIDGDRPIPELTEFRRTPPAPGADDARALARAIEKVAGPHKVLAFARSRPGGGRPVRDDLAWAETLYAAGQLASARLATIHLAHNHDVVPLVMDDLIPALT